MIGLLLLAGCIAAAVAASAVPWLRPIAFSLWVIVAFAAAMVSPQTFGPWGSFDPASLIVPLVQVIMFGMGTTLSVGDFARAVRRPTPVLIGIGTQFLVMPVVGLALANLMGFERDLTAGIVLIGSVSGGVASNLMVYLAKGNVALSVTMTACSTLVAPIMTPLLMKLLVGAIVPISFVAMMLSILNMVIVPIAAGLVAHTILYSTRPWARRRTALSAIVAVSAVVLALAIGIDWGLVGRGAAVQMGVIIGTALVLAVTIVKCVLIGRADAGPWIDRVLPAVSMAGIWIIIAIIAARSHATLMSVGIALVIAAIAHNAVGFFVGYWFGRLARLSETDCRTIAFEVGMQNGGMATGLAIDTLKNTTAAIAPAIFGTWMNISGSALASWWSRSSIPNQGPQGESGSGFKY